MQETKTFETILPKRHSFIHMEFTIVHYST